MGLPYPNSAQVLGMEQTKGDVLNTTSRRFRLSLAGFLTRADLVAGPVVLDERGLGVELAGDPGGRQRAAVRHVGRPPRQLVQAQ